MSDLASPLLAWYRRHGRHDLPWQHPRSSYRVWLAEIMLQQTQVVTVIEYFQRFVAALPDLASLARASEDEVLALWSGLGYYRRARNLHHAARICMEHHGGELPGDFTELLALPGIGRSTAAAILAQAHGKRFAILDGNVKRVLSRYHAVTGWPGETAVERKLWQFAEQHTPQQHVADYSQAIMDLGATVCTRSRPACERCPLRDGCRAFAEHLTASLPQPRPRRCVRTRSVCMLVLRDAAGRTLLEKRDAQGVWPSLWSLPEAEDPTAAIRAAARFCPEAGAGKTLPNVQHQFTHFRLTIRPILWQPLVGSGTINDNDRLRWCSAAQCAQLGIPAPVRKLLQSIE